jgi:hypothetical protein
MDSAAPAYLSQDSRAQFAGSVLVVLVLVIFAFTAARNTAPPEANLVPFFIGFTVAVLISLFAPLFRRGSINKRRPRAIVIVLKSMTARISNV